MLRYWKLIVITAIIVFSFGTYYVQNALAKSEYPEFVFKTINGDEAEIESLMVTGEYGVNEEGLSEHFNLTSEGTVYREERSYLDQLFYRSTLIERLQSDYRSFMRGKGESSTTLFENNELLAFVGPYSLDEPDDSFDVELLDKRTKERTAFQVTLPNAKEYSFINIQDVQVSHDKLIVISRNIKRGSPSESDSEEIHVYQIDLTNQKINSDEVILTSDSGSPAEWIHISEINSHSHIGQENYFVFQLGYMKGEQYGSSVRDRTEYVAYHYETNETIELDLSEEVGADPTFSKVYKDSIYFFDTEANNLQIKAYNIRNDEWILIELQTTEEVHPANLVEIKNDMLYMANFNDKQTNIYALNLEMEELVYEGKIEFANPKDEQGDYYLNLYDMVIENE
ncbi:hypothetical protein [Oceanobacillus halophilus]|uniref:DUF5050 domain-containing protein n=1 Tax=Oceanobacillus halophilus TaxID=930130 RepID=A0A495A2P9_9BACI|nr:hypothetical protein [Oceanobacillus halophilus]RKQ33216.1 hypothetical protein D8M06_10595 [Oceanobacillus halophilus]